MNKKRFVSILSILQVVVIFSLLNVSLGIYDSITENEMGQMKQISIIIFVFSIVVALIYSYRESVNYKESKSDNIKVLKRVGIKERIIKTDLLKNKFNVILIYVVLGLALSTGVCFLLKENLFDEILYLDVRSIILVFSVFIIVNLYVLTIKGDSKKALKLPKYYKYKKNVVLYNFMMLIAVIVCLVLEQYLVATILSSVLGTQFLVGFVLTKLSKTNNSFIFLLSTNVLSRFSFYSSKLVSLKTMLSLALFFTLWVQGTALGIREHMSENLEYNSFLILDSFYDKNNIENELSDYEYETFQILEYKNIHEIKFQLMLINTDGKLIEKYCDEDEDKCEEITLNDDEVILHKYIAKELEVEKGDSIKIELDDDTTIDLKVVGINDSNMTKTIIMNTSVDINEGYNYIAVEAPEIDIDEIDGLGINKYHSLEDINELYGNGLFNSQEIVEVLFLLFIAFILIYLFEDMKSSKNKNEKVNQNMSKIGISHKTLRINFILEYVTLMIIVILHSFLVIYSLSSVANQYITRKYIRSSYVFPIYYYLIISALLIIYTIFIGLNIFTKEKGNKNENID